jgi:thiol-disulfide isomerase/thioredoxin
MKRSLLITVSLFISLITAAQPGYSIKVSLKPYKNSYVYLGYYYGKVKALADSALLDENSTATFKGATPLNGGIYFLVSPRKEILFEMLIDKEQHFSMAADTANLPGSVRFTGSMDNTIFQNYTIFANNRGKEITSLTEKYRLAKNSKDSVSASSRLKVLGENMVHYRDSLSRKYPSSLIAALFRAMREPQVPPASKHPGGRYDSTFAFYYFKSHFWDGVSLDDDRLVRTPFFEPKLEKYYRDLVVPNPDSIKKEIDYMLLMSRTSKEMYKFLLVHFVQKYINPEYMGQDAIFVHLFEKYVNTGQAEFFTAQYKEHMTKRAYSLMANLIGQPASNMEMVDSLEKSLPLYNVKAPYTVVFFWDPTCGHCKEVVPKLDSIYHAKWKQQGIKIYAVMVDGGKDNWTKYIQENNLKDWIHVYQTNAQQELESKAGKPGFRQLYDVYQTPVLYLLDSDKRIVAKKLSYLQIDEVLALKLKNPKSN